jgi:type II secretory ATPase GspE/PulE/Tfp pilus assembly ATPase PilB-like protein
MKASAYPSAVELPSDGLVDSSAGASGPKSVDRNLGSLLAKAGLLSSGEVETAMGTAEKTGRPLWFVLLEDKKIGEDQLAEAIAAHGHFPLVKVAATNIDKETALLIPELLAIKFTCVPLKLENGSAEDGPARKRRASLVVAMVNPTDMQALLDLEFSTGLPIQPAVATRSEIQDAIARVYHTDEWMDGFLHDLPDPEELHLQIEGGEDEDTDENAADPRREFHKIPAVRLVNMIINRAIKEGASDIHIEPALHDLHVRYRQDGILREVMKAPKWLHEPLVSRLKILAKLDIAERRRPQDGPLRVKQKGKIVDLRVSTLPTAFGEKVVMRVLGSSQEIPSLPNLGLKNGLEYVQQAIAQPQGLLLVTGPTGSGKTTTLYSIVNAKRNPGINIVTVEDPIEFHLPGINQVQVNNKAGITFAASLRSILRQDPDVILVGEIRDLETAEIAFHAANTGRLVLSTLHTNSSVATLIRLTELGVDPYLIASSVNLIVAQRLVRGVCPNCREPYQPDPQLLRRLNLAVDMTFYHGRGCEACGRSGYLGRVGIFEILRMTPALRKLVAAKAPELELRAAAITAGITPLLEEALERVKEGVTTVEEIMRVIQIQEEGLVPCAQCGTPINPEFCICPYCLYALRRACVACRQELKPEWRICPYCSAAVPGIPIEVLPPAAQLATANTGAFDSLAASNSIDSQAMAATASAGLVVTHSSRPSDAGPSILVPPAPDLVVGKKPRILVVDDDLVSRRLAVKALQNLDLQPVVTEACSGLDGLAAIRRSQPDLVVLDVMMPGLSGFDVCEKLRTSLETAFIPILMLTADINDASRMKGFLVGTDDYMGKPFSIPELHIRVKRLLRRTYGF